jgi:predicted CoA-binding protein
MSRTEYRGSRQERTRTVVLGASPNPSRFSHKAVKSLMRHDHEVVPVGRRKGSIAGKEILVGEPPIDNVHTVSLYIAPGGQAAYYDYIISLMPDRVIFNPGTRNAAFRARLEKEGIQTIENCMLLMLSGGEF